MAGYPPFRAERCGFEPLGWLEPHRGRLRTLECFRPRRVDRLEVEGKVVRQRDLEQNSARSLRVADAIEEGERAAVVGDRLLLRV